MAGFPMTNIMKWFTDELSVDAELRKITDLLEQIALNQARQEAVLAVRFEALEQVVRQRLIAIEQRILQIQNGQFIDKK
jgi:hypothetical protein